MPYTALNPADIIAGKPTKEEIFTTIRDNQESFNTDIEALKQTSAIDIFNIKFSGSIDQYTLAEISERVPVFRAPLSATIVAFKIVLLADSTSGVLEVEIDKSTDEGVNWTPLMASPVEVTGLVTGSVSGAVSFVDVASQSFDQNDLIRLRIVGAQVDQGEFHVSIYGELS